MDRMGLSQRPHIQGARPAQMLGGRAGAGGGCGMVMKMKMKREMKMKTKGAAGAVVGHHGL